jgi:WD40 repeat protein
VTPDNRYLAVGDGAELSLWNLDTGARVLRQPARLYPMHFEKPDWLLALGPDGLKHWVLGRDPATGAVTGGQLHGVFPRAGEFPSYHVRSASPKTITSSYESFVLVAFPSGVFRPPVRLPHRDARNVVISRDGRWVATCGYFATPGDPNNVKVWDMNRPDPRTPARELPVGPSSMGAFSPDGRWLATATLNGGGRLWRVGSWEAGPEIGGTSPLFSADGQWVATETGVGELELREVATGRPLVRLPAPSGTRMRPLSFSPDGGRLVAWGRETHRLHVWELSAIRAELRAHGLNW